MTRKKYIPHTTPFWLAKTLDRTDPNYREPSEDLPLSPLLWRYNVESYERDLAELRKKERNLCKLQK